MTFVTIYVASIEFVAILNRVKRTVLLPSRRPSNCS